MPSITLNYKTDAKAGDIPAIVHYKEAAAEESPRPIAIVFHAGGFVVGSAAMVPVAEIEALKDLGFVVVTPEYRFAPQVSAYEGAIADAKDCLCWAQDPLSDVLESQVGIKVDGARVVALGHSAGGNMALHLGSIERPPQAILDFYSPKIFTDSFWTQPIAVFAAVPDVPKEFLDKVYDGPHVFKSGPMIVDGKPDLSTPRNAWMITTLKNGTNIKEVSGDGNVERIDPVTYFKHGFPPTCFVHGDADIFAPIGVSHTACSKLRDLEVETMFLTATGLPHVFDFALKREDTVFQDTVMKAFEFLRDHVQNV